jgi:AcrR family transcriptional regulator
MKERNDTRSRRQRSLTREQIIDASIRLLDEGGEGGLTFQALSKLLATGPGAIYWHVADKSDLVTAACDEIIARTMEAKQAGGSPQETIRALALDLFDAIDAHPWVGAALMSAPGQLPMVRIFERIGQQVRSLGVSAEHEWSAVSALLNYILGVAGQNAANAKLAAVQGLERASFLGEVAAAWSALDPESYPFTRSVAAQLPAHDDRKDYLDGIDLLLRGIVASS